MKPESIEDVDVFRARARASIRERFTPQTRVPGLRGGHTDEEELASVQHDRQLRRMLFDADLAGICFPRRYGGQGLTSGRTDLTAGSGRVARVWTLVGCRRDR
jgi:alkylation response protein AidB-like acyl-CoA dehydrogenase